MSLLNKPAPDHPLLDQTGTERRLADYRGHYVLLYFYPKDNTPGCTAEACHFRDSLNDFAASQVQVIGVSRDSVRKHGNFANKYRLNFPLLSDPERKLIDAYGVWTRKSMFGKIFMGIQRDSFLIDPNGRVIKHYEKVQPAQHAAEVLSDIASFT